MGSVPRLFCNRCNNFIDQNKQNQWNDDDNDSYDDNDDDDNDDDDVDHRDTSMKISDTKCLRPLCQNAMPNIRVLINHIFA